MSAASVIEPIVLGDLHRDPGDVALLEGVGPDRSGRHLARDDDQRRRVHVGVGKRGDDVGRAGAARHHGHARAARHHGVPLRHVPRSLLVAHEDVADGRVEDRVVDGQDGTPRQPEHDLYPLHLQAADEGLRAGEALGRLAGRCCHLLVSSLALGVALHVSCLPAARMGPRAKGSRKLKGPPCEGRPGCTQRCGAACYTTITRMPAVVVAMRRITAPLWHARRATHKAHHPARRGGGRRRRLRPRSRRHARPPTRAARTWRGLPTRNAARGA